MISVVIASYGDVYWADLARNRACPSAETETDDVIVCHLPDGTLADARNLGASQAKHHFLCFCDADDELAAGYIDAMEDAILARRSHSVLYTPRVSYVGGGRALTPTFHREVAPQDGNWLVIGTVISHWLFDEVGGFEDWPIYEDWACFARAQKAGAEVVKVPDAVYRAHRPARGRTGRNHSLDRAGKLATHEAIRRAVYPELYEDAR